VEDCVNAKNDEHEAATEQAEILEPAATAETAAGPQAKIAELEAQLQALKDQQLRLLAEGENNRRRAQKEREDAARYAVTDFARGLLEVADNFDRALSAMPTEALDAGLKNLVAGIEATGRQLTTVLERGGIRKLPALDQPFDPNFHRVMQEVDNADKPAGTIIQVLQCGYLIHDRLLREALVIVSKGGEKAAEKPNKIDEVA
jgi:molecular chaperone GrpE